MFIISINIPILWQSLLIQNAWFLSIQSSLLNIVDMIQNCKNLTKFRQKILSIFISWVNKIFDLQNKKLYDVKTMFITLTISNAAKSITTLTQYLIISRDFGIKSPMEIGLYIMPTFGILSECLDICRKSYRDKFFAIKLIHFIDIY